MTHKNLISCLRESQLDTIEVALRKEVEDLVSEGKFDQAEIIEEKIESLNYIPVCNTEDEGEDFRKSMPEFSRSMRFGN
jgi:hypothetical protein